MKKRRGSLSFMKASYETFCGVGGGICFFAPPRTNEATATAASDVVVDMVMIDGIEGVGETAAKASDV